MYIHIYAFIQVLLVYNMLSPKYVRHPLFSIRPDSKLKLKVSAVFKIRERPTAFIKIYWENVAHTYV